jgi:hypothetical protein
MKNYIVIVHGYEKKQIFIKKLIASNLEMAREKALDYALPLISQEEMDIKEVQVYEFVSSIEINGNEIKQELVKKEELQELERLAKKHNRILG